MEVNKKQLSGTLVSRTGRVVGSVSDFQRRNGINKGH